MGNTPALAVAAISDHQVASLKLVMDQILSHLAIGDLKLMAPKGMEVKRVMESPVTTRTPRLADRTPVHEQNSKLAAGLQRKLGADQGFPKTLGQPP